MVGFLGCAFWMFAASDRIRLSTVLALKAPSPFPGWPFL